MSSWKTKFEEGRSGSAFLFWIKILQKYDGVLLGEQMGSNPVLQGSNPCAVAFVAAPLLLVPPFRRFAADFIHKIGLNGCG